MFGEISFTYLLVVILSMVISVTLHEVMHGLVAHHLGDTTAQEAGRLTLNPLKHIDLVTTVLLPVVMIALHVPPIFIAKPVPFDPDQVRGGEFGAALVALAGPLTNFVLAVLGSVILHLISPASETAYYLLVFMQINIMLFVFNMIPFPPLDGSRLLYAVAPEPLQRVMYQIEQAGFGVTILVFLLISSFILPVITNISDTILNFLV